MRPRRLPEKSLYKDRLRGARQHPTVSLADRLVQRAAHLSQLGLLALGVVVYVFTVLPVYQHQQLQEQTAKLVLEKNSIERELNTLREQAAGVKSEISALTESWQSERARSAQLAAESARARDREALATRQRSEVEAALTAQIKALDAARWELVHHDFFFEYMRTLLRGEQLQSAREEPGTFILQARKHWPQPFEDLLEAANNAAKKRTGAERMPDSFYAELRRFVVARQALLQCLLPDFDAIHAGFLVQLSALDQNVDAETTERIASLVREYAAKNQRLEITQDFRAKTRHAIRVGKVYELERSYRDRLSALRKACQERATSVIEELRQAKNLPR